MEKKQIKCESCYLNKRLTIINFLMSEIINMEDGLNTSDLTKLVHLKNQFTFFKESIENQIPDEYEYHIDTMENWIDTDLLHIVGEGTEHPHE